MNVQAPSDFRQAASNSGLVPGYMSGFGNGFETEALPGALPVGRNSPQKCPYALYAEQLSGSPFTAPRVANERSWLYRIRPTVAHWGAFRPADIGLWRTAPASEARLPIGPMRWDPIAIPSEPISFVEGVRTMTTAGDAGAHQGGVDPRVSHPAPPAAGCRGRTPSRRRPAAPPRHPPARGS